MDMPKVKVISLDKEFVRAIRLIDKLITTNGYTFKYSVNIDYKSKNYGTFDPQKANHIYLNPSLLHDAKRHEDPHALYFTSDFSIYAVVVHEFAHLLDAKLNLQEKYESEFSDKLILNKNSKTDRREELAEVMSLYILNPYLLKLIDKSRFIFLKGYFLSPTVCRKSNFISKWNGWPEKIQGLCEKQWRIRVSGQKVLILA